MKILNNKFKSSLPLIRGDLFTHINDRFNNNQNKTSIIIPHVCNNINLFGAGFAHSVALNYPIVKENYHLLGNHFLKNNLGYTQFVEVAKDSYGHKLIFANMISQNGIRSSSHHRPLNYYALTQSMSLVSKFISKYFDKENRVEIHAPKFGCGLAGGNWNLIEYLIEDIWHNIPVYIYQLGKA